MTSLVYCQSVADDDDDDDGFVLTYSMAEELPSGVTMGNILTGTGLLSKYDQSILKTFQYDVLQGDYKKYFQVSRSNWGRVDLMTSGEPLDRDAVCPGQLKCVITLDIAVVKPIERFQVFPVEITVTDNNDNSPKFDLEEFVIDVSETAVPGPATQFVVPTAHDPDSGTFGIQDYQFTTDSDKFNLEIRNNSDGSFDLRLTLVKSLDRELQSTYSMVVTAYDGVAGGQRKSGSLNVKVNVIDANDNSPVFDKNVYEVTVSEDVSSGTTLTQVHASDSDQGLNGEVVYGLSAQTIKEYPNAFDINNKTGEVYVFTALDYEAVETYNLVVTARDRGPSSVPSHAKVVVKVQDINDHPPMITINSLTGSGQPEVMENAGEGVFIAHVTVEDKDKGEGGQTSCDVDRRVQGDFVLEKLYKNRFKVLTKRSFDREASPEYNLIIQCVDHGVPPLSTSVTYKVKILDDNDNAPEFQSQNYSRNLRENNTLNVPLLRVNATDRDAGKNAEITYHLSANAQDMLAIDSKTGVVTAQGVFDHEVMSTFQFEIIATDQGDVSKFSTANVILNILDINDEAPVFSQKYYNFGTFENQPNGTEIGTISASDPDDPPFNTFKYSLDPNRSDLSVFQINEVSGRITTKRVLDREHQAAYYLVAVATDTAYPYLSSTANVTIYVADKNDNAPMILHPNHDNHTVQLSSYSPRGHTFYKIVAKDADLGSNARLTFSFGKGNHYEAFDIDPSTGVISVKGDLQSINLDSYHLLIMVKDGGIPSKSAVATLYVVINFSEAFARETLSTLPQFKDQPTSSEKLGFHQKIIIILGCVTAVLVAILVTAILCIRRKQMRQEKESYKYMCRMDIAQRLSEHQVDGHGTLPPPYSTAIAGDLVTPDMNMHDVTASTSDASGSRLTFEVIPYAFHTLALLCHITSCRSIRLCPLSASLLCTNV